MSAVSLSLALHEVESAQLSSDYPISTDRPRNPKLAHHSLQPFWILEVSTMPPRIMPTRLPRRPRHLCLDRSHHRSPVGTSTVADVPYPPGSGGPGPLLQPSIVDLDGIRCQAI